MKKIGKRILSTILAVATLMSCWVWMAPEQSAAAAANNTLKDHYLFAYFTGTSKDGQTIHLAVSEDGYNYTALRDNEPILIPSKGVGCVRDPYIWYNQQDNYYYIIATDLDFTDGGGDLNNSWALKEKANYCDNSQSFLIWRSKDLINWYDETMIDVAAMSNIIGDTRNLTQVWAPQVLWDGSAYVVYFTLCCEATRLDNDLSKNNWRNMQLVYLKTTNLMDQNAYYEYGVLYDPQYNVIDADIIYNESNKKWYLFYKNENDGWNPHGHHANWKSIHCRVGDSPTGPFSPPSGAHDEYGYHIFSSVAARLEGGNGFFDNNGNLVVYADAYDNKDAVGNEKSFFYVARSNGNDFTNWTIVNESNYNGTFNINDLGPRHGSVVKITEEEYNRLLNNAYAINSSSCSIDETLEDHLVGRFFTTANVLENTVVGKPDLDSSQGITMEAQPTTGSYYAQFNGSNGYASIDLDKLFLNDLNYDDGFTITFKAKVPTSAATHYNQRVFEISQEGNFGKRTGIESYLHFSPVAEGNGSYVGSYYGPGVVKADLNVADTHSWASDENKINRTDDTWHEYLISSANGNIIVYIDGQIAISRNRFTTGQRAWWNSDSDKGNQIPVRYVDEWYKTIGNSTMLIGKSGWDADPYFEGAIRDLCIYDCSMSYYDIKEVDSGMKSQLDWINPIAYNGATSITKVPTFQNTDENRMKSLPSSSEHFSNVLYTEKVLNYDGNNMSNDSAVYHYNGNDFYFALYYPETTVLLYDGVNPTIMPISFGSYCQNSRASKGFLQVYPTTGPGSTADNTDVEISQNWAGWYNNGDYYNCIVSHEDGYIGRNSSTSSWSHITDKKNYDCHWGAPLKVKDTIDFGDTYCKKLNLTWQVNGGVDGSYAADHSANMTSGNDIYIINYKAILDIRKTISESEFNSIMNDESICLALRQRYAQAVFTINTLTPFAYDFSGRAQAELSAKAMGKAIKEAISNYNGAKESIDRARAEGADASGHLHLEIAGREPTCMYDGLTTGEYCELCGKVFVEQTPIPALAHTFTDVTEDGVNYKKCTVCGVKIENKLYELRYENLFSFNQWADSASAQVVAGPGTIDRDYHNGRITIQNNHTSEVYTRGNYDGQNCVSTRDYGNYCIAVNPGTTYVVEATNRSDSTSNGDVFVFQYDREGRVYSSIPNVIGGLTPGETRAVEFTLDANAAFIELRFDCNDAGKTITYSDIGVYTKEDFDAFGTDTANSRLTFYPGDNKEVNYPNPTAGYSFGGWYTKGGTLIENVNQLNNPTTIVYGKWIPAGFNIVYDSIFSFADWAKSSCNRLWYGDQKDANGNVTRLVSSKGILADSENGTLTITNDADTTYFARTNYWVDSGNVYKTTLEQNTDYIIEYTATSDDGAKPNVCAYITGGTAQYPESGGVTKYSLGTQYFRINSGDNTNLTLRFDNVQHGSTVTFSGIAVYKAEAFEEAAQTITNREYLRYYSQKGMGIGDVFEYTPTRPGYTFENWFADIDDTLDGEAGYDCKNLPDDFSVDQNWHLFSQWTENDYFINYHANGGSGTVISKDDTQRKYTATDPLWTGDSLSRTGYALKGWSTIPNATSAMYQLGQGVSRLCGDKDGTIDLYAVWSPNVYNITFDNLIDFDAWNKTSSKGTVSDITNTGFTLTSNDDVSEATTTSPLFPVTAGKQYKIDADITDFNNLGWDIYIFFYDDNTQSGLGIDFQDGAKNRFSSDGTNSNHLFTAPSGATRAVIRVDTNKAKGKVRFDNIRVYEEKLNPISGYSYRYKGVTYDSDYPSQAFVPIREGYDFQGWYNSANTQYYGKLADRLSGLGKVNFINTLKLFSQWKLNDKALTEDKQVVDFGAALTLNPVTNDTIFLNESKNQNNSDYTVSVTAGDTELSASGKNVTFKTASVINAARKLDYFTKLVSGDTTELNGKITVIPASNVLYEENVLGTSTTDKVDWTKDGTASSNTQSTSTEELYGYDAMYVNVTGNHSNGSAIKTTVSSSANRSETLTFTFTGTGFELYGACGNNTGVQVIAVRDSSGNLVKSAVVDTYYNDSYGTLYQTPIYNVSGLGYGTYTVEVTAAYLSMAGALKAQSAEVFGTLSTNDNELADALAEVGLDYILEAEDVDVEWFDDESILNGGTGANDPTAFGTQSATSLVNYVDAVRVFEPLVEADENTHYIDSEKNARYYNINDNLMSKAGFIAGGKGFVYVEGNNNFGFDAEDYNSKGSKHEIYLTNASQGENALVFSVSGAGGYNKAMLSLRSATGGDIKVKIGGKELTVSSKTDMYYDITDYVNSDGTVTIENATANSLLAIGYLKLTGQAVLETTSDLSSAIEMIETPLDGEEITTGAITNVEYTPSTDSHNTFDVTVNGRPTMIQFIEEDGGTRTYDRNNKNVTIKSYNADGVEVNSLDRTVAYEVWTINTNLTGPEVKARAKFITDGAYKWEKNPYSFTYEILEPVLDADVRSVTPAAVSGKKGAVEVKVVTGPDAQGVRFVMPDGSTCTYNAAKAVTLENGDLEFTGKAWMNEDGLNTISVYIRENNVWNSVGTIEYTAE